MRLITFLLLLPISLGAQNWSTQGGNNSRNGQSPYAGPVLPAVRWTNSSLPSAAWGGATYIEGNRFATYRYLSGFGGTVSARLVVGDLLTGQVLFSFLPQPNAVMLPLGIRDNRLYAVNYRTQQGDTLYAIDLTTFEVLWKTPPICWNGFTSGIQFTCDGDPIVNGTVPAQSVMRLDRHTGAVVWANNHFTTINGSNGTCMVGDRIYTWQGSIIDPKTVRVIDANTGLALFNSSAQPGDGDQEIRLTAAPDSTIYACRDGGKLYALRDTGTGFAQRWTYTFTGTQPGVYSNFAVSPLDGSVYVPDDGFIVRLDAATGAVLDVTDAPLPGYASLMTIDREGRLYVATSGAGAEGQYVAFAPDLGAPLWTLAVPANYYSAPALGREGIMLVSGSGTTLRALQTQSILEQRPVASFEPSAYTIFAGEALQFTDLSSYAPVVYQWSFPGGTPASATGPVPPPVVYAAPGTYAVELIVGNIAGTDTLRRACLLEVLPDPSATTAPAQWGALTVQPNPATQQCRVLLPEAMTGVTVFDAAGRVVAALPEQAAGTLQVELNDWKPGMYWLTARGAKATYAARFLKID